ncbi:hypothetical protein ABZ896_52175, partial [Streptomyces sp. NPDC047072]
MDTPQENRRTRLYGRLVIAAVAGCAVLGTALMLLPLSEDTARRRGPGRRRAAEGLPPHQPRHRLPRLRGAQRHR